MHELLQKILTYLRSMWRYRWFAMGVMWIIVSIGWYKVYKLPDLYEVNASVHVNTESVLRPLLQGLAIDPNLEQRLRLLSQTLKARENMEKLAQMSEMEMIKDHSNAVEISVDDLISNIQLTSSRGENIYTLSYTNEDPELAKVVVENLLKIIIEKTLSSTGSDEDQAKKFLKDQLSNSEKKLSNAEDRLKEFKKNNAALMPNLGKGYFENLQAVRDTLANAELELDEAIKRRDELKRQISGEEPVFGFAPLKSNQGIAHPLDPQIQDLQKQLDTLLLKYTEHHPQVISIKDTIERLQKEKEKDLANRPKVNMKQPELETNPVYQQLSVALSEAEAQVAALRVRVNEYKQREINLKKMVDTIPQFEAELTRLKREYETQQQNYEDMRERYETAIISNEVDQTGSTVEVKVLEPPRLPLKPSGPNRLWFNSLVFIFGFGAAVGLAFILSEIKPVVYETRTLNNITGIPVYGVVSMIMNRKTKKSEFLEYGGYISAFTIILVTYTVIIYIQN